MMVAETVCSQGTCSPFHVLAILFMFVFVFVFVCAIWITPIVLGVRAARKKNYSPCWMLFGIHPLLGWIACIVLLCAPPRIRCSNCGGLVTVNFRICPYCHAELAKTT
jgi:uncharacterized membrane protein HdeD (DUF308 family)